MTAVAAPYIIDEESPRKQASCISDDMPIHCYTAPCCVPLDVGKKDQRLGLYKGFGCTKRGDI